MDKETQKSHNSGDLCKNSFHPSASSYQPQPQVKKLIFGDQQEYHLQRDHTHNM